MDKPAITITLSACECKIAVFIGKRRNQLSLQTKENGRRDPNQTDEEMNIQAVGAELACAKYLNVYPDLSPTAGELRQWDLVKNGVHYEVKRNHLESGDLLIPKLREGLIYILVCGEMPKYTIVGYLPGMRVKETGEWVNLTYGPCWRVSPHLLSRF
jgi:hypothetical protein